jgi:hypothetical protein
MNTLHHLALRILFSCIIVFVVVSCKKDDECAPASTAIAGPDQNVVGITTSLAANLPETGAGTWSIVSGDNGALTDPLDATTTFTGTLGNTYILKWSVTGCPISEDEVTITFGCDPALKANAGADQTIIGTAATLAGNVTTGSWSIISGTGGTITETTNAASAFTGVIGTTYVLRWTVACPESSDDVQITLSCDPASGANAGPDQNIAATSATLAANTPTSGSGTWTIISGSDGIITTPASPASTFSGVIGTTYVLRWTVTCPATQDDVQITFNDGSPQLITVDKTSIVNGEVITVTGVNFTSNYNGGSQIDGLKIAEPLAGQTVYPYIISRTATEIKAIMAGTNGGAEGAYDLRYNKKPDAGAATIFSSNLTVEVVTPSVGQFYTSQAVTSTNVPKGSEASFGIKNGSLVASDYTIKLVAYDYTSGLSTEYNAAVTGITASGFGGTMDKLAFTVPASIPSDLYYVLVTYNGKTMAGGWGQFVNTF